MVGFVLRIAIVDEESMLAWIDEGLGCDILAYLTARVASHGQWGSAVQPAAASAYSTTASEVA